MRHKRLRPDVTPVNGRGPYAAPLCRWTDDFACAAGFNHGMLCQSSGLKVLDAQRAVSQHVSRNCMCFDEIPHLPVWVVM